MTSTVRKVKQVLGQMKLLRDEEGRTEEEDGSGEGWEWGGEGLAGYGGQPPGTLRWTQDASAAGKKSSGSLSIRRATQREGSR